MKLRRLFATFHWFDLRQDSPQKPGAIEQIPAADSVRRKKNTHQLVANSFRADLGDGGRDLHERVPGLLFNIKLEHGGETNLAQHLLTIFHEPLLRITYHL